MRLYTTSSLAILYSSSAYLVPNSTTWTPAADVLYNTTNGQAHKNSASCCTTNLPHRNARAEHLKMLGCGKFWSVGGEFVVQQVVELL